VRSPGQVAVTFRLPASVNAASIAVVGDFNAWDPGQDLLRRQADGTWRHTVTLHAGRRYRFRYLLDGYRWENDWAADDYVANDAGGTDSVVGSPRQGHHSAARLPRHRCRTGSCCVESDSTPIAEAGRPGWGFAT